MSDQEAVLATLEEYAAAYCSKDTDRQMSIFDDGDDISLIGTGADALCAGHAEIRAVLVRNFATATAVEFQWHWKLVAMRDDCAIIAVNLTIHLETDTGPLQVLLRWTVSLIKRAGAWKWLHRHASAATDSQKEGGAYPTNRIG